MGNRFEYMVSLRVTHPRWHPDEISSRLGMAPSRSWLAGEPRKAPKGQILGGVRVESYCAYDFGGAHDGALAECLREALVKLAVHREFLRELRSTGGSLSFFCTWGADGDTGETFDRDLLGQIADLQIDLGINVLE